MIIRKSLVFLLTLALSVLATQAEAAPAKKASKLKSVKKIAAPAEVYAATEEAPSSRSDITAFSQTELETPGNSPATDFTAPEIIAAPAHSPTSPITPPAQVEIVAVSQTQKRAQNFDTVPPRQTESIVRRIRLVELILLKSGRAYDYRVYTTRELEGILNQLQAASKPAAPRVYDSELPPMSPSESMDFSSHLNQNS